MGSPSSLTHPQHDATQSQESSWFRHDASSQATGLSRRGLIVGLAGLLGAACCPTVIDRPGEQIAAAPANPPPDAPPDPLDSLEAAVGGRLGVIAMDSADGAVLLARRPDERFAMCSSFKWALAAAVLARVDRGELALAEPVPYAEADLLQHSPVTREHLAEGAMSLEALAEAAVVTSDNAAANLLLAKIGGPAGLTAFLRAEGDDTTRLDRTEPTLNENTPGDPRDTTTPRAMATSLSRLLLGPSLSEASRARLMGWLRACETGKRRLRAGLPSAWPAGDKTGTCNSTTACDVAIVAPPGRAPVVIAAYLSEAREPLEALDAVLAAVGREVAARLA